MSKYTKALAERMGRTKSRIMQDLVNEMFNKSYSVYADDTLMSELTHDGGVPMSRVKEMLARILSQGELPLDNVYRVEIGENANILLTDFTLPSSSSTLKKTIPLSEAPDFIRSGLAVLQIAQDDTQIEGVGKRITEKIYYILERHGSDPREEGERCS